MDALPERAWYRKLAEHHGRSAAWWVVERPQADATAQEAFDFARLAAHFGRLIARQTVLLPLSSVVEPHSPSEER